MAGVLKATVVALVIIAAQKQFSVAASSKVYNIKEFVAGNTALLIIRTNYSTFNPCKWYQQQGVSDTGVTMSAWVYIDNTKRKVLASPAKTWIFKEEDKIWTGDEDSDGDRDEKWLLYKTEDDSCGVLRFDELYDSIDIRRTYYELLVTQDKMHTIPEECLNFYLEKIGTAAENKNSNEDLNNCKLE